jgi:hypothetical protein
MACSKYTITNTGSTIVNFNYRRCDDSMWEYQVELLPSQTKNVWLMDDTYSTAYYNNIEIVGTESWPPPAPTIDVYSQDISGNFPIPYVSCRFRCDGSNFNNEYTSETANSVQEVANIFNSNSNFNQYGTYFDNGDGRLGLSMVPTLVYTLCPSGDIDLNVYDD